MARWPDSEPLWTGSYPCQPFSLAGKQKGTADDRHLWPEMFKLVRAARPAAVVGEQVAGKAGYGWFDGVQSDLESEGYASRAVDIPACAVGAPHIRHRLWWVAKPEGEGRCGRDTVAESGNQESRGSNTYARDEHGLANSSRTRYEQNLRRMGEEQTCNKKWERESIDRFSENTGIGVGLSSWKEYRWSEGADKRIRREVMSNETNATNAIEEKPKYQVRKLEDGSFEISSEFSTLIGDETMLQLANEMGWRLEWVP